MKRFFTFLLSILLLVSLCACGQKKGYTEEEQTIIDALYSMQSEGVSMQNTYDEWDGEHQELMLAVTEALYNANAREYYQTISLLKTTSVVIPDDLPDALPAFQK